MTSDRGHQFRLRHRLQPMHLDRLRCLPFLHGGLQTNRAICSMPSPLGIAQNQSFRVFRELP